MPKNMKWHYIVPYHKRIFFYVFYPNSCWQTSASAKAEAERRPCESNGRAKATAWSWGCLYNHNRPIPSRPVPQKSKTQLKCKAKQKYNICRRINREQCDIAKTCIKQGPLKIKFWPIYFFEVCKSVNWFKSYGLSNFRTFIQKIVFLITWFQMTIKIFFLLPLLENIVINVI